MADGVTGSRTRSVPLSASCLGLCSLWCCAEDEVKAEPSHVLTADTSAGGLGFRDVFNLRDVVHLLLRCSSRRPAAVSSSVLHVFFTFLSVFVLPWLLIKS